MQPYQKNNNMNKNLLIIFASAVVLSTGALRAKAAQIVENDLYAVSINPVEGSFAVVSKPAGKAFLTAGKLSGTGGATRVVELTDKTFGKGNGVEIRYANGNRETVGAVSGPAVRPVPGHSS